MIHKVLLVEDEDMIRKGIKYGVDWTEFDCAVVGDTHSATEAVKLIEKHKPNILIIDINMPVMSGLDVIKKTHNQYDYTTIIISGYSDFDYAQTAIKLGVIRYISKPINMDELKNSLQVAVNIEKEKKLLNASQKLLDDEKKLIQTIKTQSDAVEQDPVVNQILDYVEKNYMKKIKLDDVVQHVNYSKSTINSKMKNVIGKTFNKHLNDYRIFIVIERLNQNYNNIDIRKLSFDVGFVDFKYFQEVFKKHIGLTPNEYMDIKQSKITNEV